MLFTKELLGVRKPLGSLSARILLEINESDSCRAFGFGRRSSNARQATRRAVSVPLFRRGQVMGSHGPQDVAVLLMDTQGAWDAKMSKAWHLRKRSSSLKPQADSFKTRKSESRHTIFSYPFPLHKTLT